MLADDKFQGWQLDCDDRQLLSTEPILHNNTELWKTCKSSTVYPGKPHFYLLIFCCRRVNRLVGQTFSNPDSTFIFEALTLVSLFPSSPERGLMESICSGQYHPSCYLGKLPACTRVFASGHQFPGICEYSTPHS